MLENMIIKPVAVIQPFSPDGSVAWQAQELLQYFTYLWWECDATQPTLPYGGTPQEKKARENQLERLADGLAPALRRILARGSRGTGRARA